MVQLYGGKSIRINLSAVVKPIENNRFKISIRITNKSKSRLESYSSKGPVRISYRWVLIDNLKEISAQFERRVETDFSLAPNESQVQAFEINGPPTNPDNYLLEITLVQDGVAWFHELGMRIERMEVPTVTSD